MSPQGVESRSAKGASARSGEHAAFEVLRSKLDVPQPRAGIVERSGVVERLARRRSGRFVSVVAPPGYGKTTALGQWAAADGRRFAWVSLDHRDNDPVVFLTYVAEALNVDGEIKPAVFKSLRGAGDSVWARGLPRLGAALASRKEPVVLVLDDVHELVNDDCLDALTALMLHVPVASTLVLSGRVEARLGLPKLRADGELLELGPAGLALNDAEARALLNAAGVDVSEQEAKSLNEHAEGWAAGLYLAALALDGDAKALAGFGGDDRFVSDYIRSEHLARLDPEEIEFLTRTSVLDRMSGPLCDAVLERDDSALRLGAIAADNLFVIPLNHKRVWFRYHHLFKEMLAGELRRREPELVTRLNRRAATWCEANGDPEAAIEYWAAASEFDEVARLFTALAFPLYRTGRVTTLERWLELFDDERLLEAYPAVAVFGVLLHAMRGRPEAAERWAVAVRSSSSTAPMPDGSPREAWVATAQALMGRRGIEQMLKDADFAVSNLSAQSPFRPVSMLLQGVSTLLAGRDAVAEPMLKAAAECAEVMGGIYAGVVAHGELALLALERGDLGDAGNELAVANALVQDVPSPDYVANGLLLAATARLAIARGQGAQARQTLVAAQRIRPQLTHAISWFAVQTQLELAKAHLALSDSRGASTLYHEADEILRRRPRLGVLVDQAEGIRAQLTTVADKESGWASTLTAAELRLLPLLTTHLSFREIAERLFVSRNTVKTQAISVYRKLDASSRSEAIERATELGLVDASPAARNA